MSLKPDERVVYPRWCDGGCAAEPCAWWPLESGSTGLGTPRTQHEPRVPSSLPHAEPTCAGGQEHPCGTCWGQTGVPWRKGSPALGRGGQRRWGGTDPQGGGGLPQSRTRAAALVAASIPLRRVSSAQRTGRALGNRGLLGGPSPFPRATCGHLPTEAEANGRSSAPGSAAALGRTWRAVCRLLCSQRQKTWRVLARVGDPFRQPPAPGPAPCVPLPGCSGASLAQRLLQEVLLHPARRAPEPLPSSSLNLVEKHISTRGAGAPGSSLGELQNRTIKENYSVKHQRSRSPSVLVLPPRETSCWWRRNSQGSPKAGSARSPAGAGREGLPRGGGGRKIGFSCKNSWDVRPSGPSRASRRGCRAFRELRNSQVLVGARKLRGFMGAYFTARCQEM